MKTYSNKSSSSGYKTITLTNTGINTGINFNFSPPAPIKVKKVIYNNPATIVYFTDGSKTVVKACEDDRFDEQIGLLMCIAKRFLGDDFHRVLKENVPNYEKKKVMIKIGRFEISEEEFLF